MYKYKMMDFYCTKCSRVAESLTVGTTSHDHLIVAWFCKGCRVNVTALVPLEAMRASVAAIKIAAPVWTDEDKKLMKEMHIGGEDER